MTDARLSPLDASFLEVESATAHMHVGWAARFTPPTDRRLLRRPRDRTPAPEPPMLSAKAKAASPITL